MLFKDSNLGKIYTIEDVLMGQPCTNCTPCLRLRLIELGLLKGEKIRVRDHKLGIWMIDVLSQNDNTTYTLALRDEEADRVCLL